MSDQEKSEETAADEDVSPITDPTTAHIESEEELTKSDKKRVADELEPEDKPKRARTDNLLVIKMLCPFWCAGAVIGTKGAGIKQLKEESGCLIRVTKNHENFPMTSERVVAIRGEVEHIKKVIVSVQNKIRNDNPPPSAPRRDNSKRKSCIKLVVSVSSAGRIIGKGGEQTKALQSRHNVHIAVMKTADLPTGLNESVVTISGEDSGSVDACLGDVINLVSEDERANLNYNLDYAVYNRQQPPPPKFSSVPIAPSYRGNQFRSMGSGWGQAPQPSMPFQGWSGGGFPHQWGSRGNYGNRRW